MKYLFIYVAVTIGSLLFVRDASATIRPEFLLLLSCLLATLGFHALNFGKMIDVYRELLGQARWYLALMVCNVFIWVAAFWGDAYLSPFFVTFAIFGGGSACTAFAELRKSFSVVALVERAPLFVVMAAFLVFNATAGGGFVTVTLKLAAIVVLSAASFLYAATSVKFSKRGLTSSQILAARFWLLIALLLPVVVLGGHGASLSAISHAWPAIVVTSVATFLIPTFCYQNAVIRLGARATLSICCLIPGLTLIAQHAMEVNVSSDSVLAMSILSLSLAAGPAWAWVVSGRAPVRGIARFLDPQQGTPVVETNLPS
ncbi:hypothetical protein [Paraburkholderia sediminicola]|uniref:hypothetical protein n=1 Tax=Paraburkholderia sediminicola TaxID=458836 RepID=UPI0038BCFB73